MSLTVARICADYMSIHTGGDSFHAGKIVPVVLHKIHFCQQDHRSGPGLPGKGQIPLQPLGIEIHVQGLHDEHIVKIGSYRLISGDGPRLPAGKESAPGQGGDD